MTSHAALCRDVGSAQSDAAFLIFLPPSPRQVKKDLARGGRASEGAAGCKRRRSPVIFTVDIADGDRHLRASTAQHAAGAEELQVGPRQALRSRSPSPLASKSASAQINEKVQDTRPWLPPGNGLGESTGSTDASAASAVLQLPTRALRFDAARILSIHALLQQQVRFLPARYRPVGPPADGGSHAPDTRAPSFSLLALVRDIGPLEQQHFWAPRPAGARMQGTKQRPPELDDECIVELIDADGSTLSVVLQRELATRWVSADDESINRDESSITQAMETAQSGAAPQASDTRGGVTLALLETYDGDRPRQRRPMQRPAPLADEREPVKLRAGDVIALSGLVLRPVNPHIKDGDAAGPVPPAAATRRLGVTRNKQPGPPQGPQEWTWDGLRAIADPRASPPAMIELCYRSEVRDARRDARYCYDVAALAQIDDRYARIWEMAKLWTALRAFRTENAST